LEKKTAGKWVDIIRIILQKEKRADDGVTEGLVDNLFLDALLLLSVYYFIHDRFYSGATLLF